MKTLSYAFAMLALIATGCDQDDRKWDTRYDALLDRSDVQVEFLTNDKGEEIRHFTLPGGVYIEEIRDGDDYRVWAEDTSGLGAVQCAWEIYASLHFYATKCEAQTGPELAAILGGAVERIEEFMRQNALVPMSKDEFDREKAEWLEYQEDQFSQQEPEQACQLGPLLHTADLIATRGENEFNASIDKLLSVPRLPVMNPCL